jgi:rod shape-determining protein MreC
MVISREFRFWLVQVFYIFFFLFLINRLFFSSSGMVERSVSCLLYPFLKVHSNITQSLELQHKDRQTVENLRKELDGLYVQYDVMQGRVNQLQAQQLFLEQSASLVDFAHRYEQTNKTAAKILLCEQSSDQDIVFIEGGINKNFVKDDIVVYQNALVGRIIELYPWYSKVALITDRRCRIAAQISADVSGICCGKNNNLLELNFVPHFKPVAVGEIVISSGQGLVYPQGFAMGVVQSVKTDLVSHEIVVKSMFEIDHVAYVYVLHK